MTADEDLVSELGGAWMKLIHGLRSGHTGCENGGEGGRVGTGRRLRKQILCKHMSGLQVPKGELSARLRPVEAGLRSERLWTRALNCPFPVHGLERKNF